MPTTIQLQGKIAYGLLPLWILFFILISPLIIKVINKRRLKKKAKNATQVVENTEPVIPVSVSIRDSYVNKLETLRNEYKTGKRSDRDSFLLLSFYIRDFVLELTGIDITKKTLAEIRAHDLPEIIELIETYYAYEFAPDKTGDVDDAIDKTIQVIKTWS